VGGTGVGVSGTGVGVGSAGVDVGVGSADVGIGSIVVAVGGTGVGMGATRVAVGDGLALQPLIIKASKVTKRNSEVRIFISLPPGSAWMFTAAAGM
jgi:hypothetical protein